MGIGGSGPHTFDDSISADPLFVDPSSGDYRLPWTSPCHNTGSDALLPCDEFDLDGDGHDCVTNVEPVPYDLDGDTVSPVHVRQVCIVDMGAFEIQTTSCTGDITGGGNNPPDHVVNIDDLLAVILHWGNPNGGFADVTCAGLINIDDLLAVILNWGVCTGYTGGDPGQISTIQDCIDAASAEYDIDTHYQDWSNFLQKCIQGLCEA